MNRSEILVIFHNYQQGFEAAVKVIQTQSRLIWFKINKLISEPHPETDASKKKASLKIHAQNNRLVALELNREDNPLQH